MGFEIGTADGAWGPKSCTGLILYQFYKWPNNRANITGEFNQMTKDALAADYAAGITYSKVMAGIKGKKVERYLGYYDYKYNGKMPADGVSTVVPTSSNEKTRAATEMGIAWAKMYDAALRDSTMNKSSALMGKLLIQGTRSAYRLHEDQAYFYCVDYNHNTTYSAYPGTSNHGWGYAIDIAISAQSGDKSKPQSGNDKTAFDWIAKNIESFGMMRYSAEAWHYDVREVRSSGSDGVNPTGTRPVRGNCPRCGKKP